MATTNSAYKVDRIDGEPIDSEAVFLVLRLDRRENDAERWAARTYALFLKDREKADGIVGVIDRITDKYRDTEFAVYAEGRDGGVIRGS